MARRRVVKRAMVRKERRRRRKAKEKAMALALVPKRVLATRPNFAFTLRMVTAGMTQEKSVCLAITAICCLTGTLLNPKVAVKAKTRVKEKAQAEAVAEAEAEAAPDSALAVRPPR